MASSNVAKATNGGSGDTTNRLPITIQGKSAFVSFDDELIWLNRAGSSEGGAKDPEHSYVCVPHALVLHSSFIPDSDGGSLLLRLLAPPTNVERSSLPPFKPLKSRAAQAAELRKRLDSEDVRQPKRRLAAQLNGPCSNLRLIKVEARVNEASLTDEATQWAERLMKLAYPDTKPYRKLRVLVNPFGGQGKAVSLFTSRIRPILDAAGCTLDVTLTTRAFHGTEIAETLPLSEKFDAIVCVSGDGMLHEVLNGLAKRKDAVEALSSLSVAPIPAGSGNGTAVNLLGAVQGFNLALASLNVIKGTPMAMDVCRMTQPADAESVAADGSADARRRTLVKRRSARGKTIGTQAASATGGTQETVRSPDEADPVTIPTAPTLPYETTYSFLSQAIGLMADIDLGTEHLRVLGDTRFILGFIGGVMSNKECEIDLYVKLGERGTLNKAEMRKSVQAAHDAAAATTTNGSAVASDAVRPNDDSDTQLRNGSVVDELPDGALDSLPGLIPADPSWPNALLAKSDDAPYDPSRWYRVQAPISAMYAGKIPYVGRDLLQFPFSLPDDRCIDLALMLHGGGRMSKLRAISVAETGSIVYDGGIAYIKCEAYRVVPRLQSGHKRLKKGGLVAIDGERKPYAPFQVEVDHRVQMRILSLYGQWQVPDVAPPTAAQTNGA